MEADKCPSCGAPLIILLSKNTPNFWECNSSDWGSGFVQHDVCRIRELEAENVELKIQINVLESELENR